MAKSARRRTEAGGQEARHEDSVRHAAGGGRAPSLARTREPCQPQRPGGRPVCRPTAGPAQAPSPPPAEDRQEACGPAGWAAAGRAAPSSRTGWAGQDNLAGGNAAKSQPRAPGPRTGTRAPCTAVTRQHARRPGTPGHPTLSPPLPGLAPRRGLWGLPAGGSQAPDAAGRTPTRRPAGGRRGLWGHPTGGPGAPQPLRG